MDGLDRSKYYSEVLPKIVNQVIRYGLLLVGVVSTVLAIASDFAGGNVFLEDWIIKNAASMGVVLHLVFFALILFPGWIRPLDYEADNVGLRMITEHLNRDFLRAWKFTWIFLGLQYSVLLFGIEYNLPDLDERTVEEFHASRKFIHLAIDLANYASSFFLLAAFYFLSVQYFVDMKPPHGYLTDVEATGIKKHLRWLYSHAFIKRVALITVILFLVSSVIRLYDLGLHFDHSELFRAPAFLIGMASALAIGHFAGRLDSKFVMDWNWIVPLMFFYAAIQTFTSVHYEEDALSKAIFTYGAFTMKCILYIYVNNFFEKRRVVYYAHKLNTVQDDVI